MFSKRYDQQLSAFDFQNEFSKLYPDYIYFKHIKTFFIWLVGRVRWKKHNVLRDVFNFRNSIQSNGKCNPVITLEDVDGFSLSRYCWKMFSIQTT